MEAKGARFKKFSKITIQILNGIKSSVSDPGSFVRIRMGLYSQARIRIGVKNPDPCKNGQKL